MTVPYLARLACLSLACYFLLHTILGAAVWAFSGRVVGAVERMRPRDAARLVLALRLLPPIAALVAVAALCIPSFLLLEPSETVEAAGIGCLLAAVLAASLWVVSLARAVRAALQSRRYVRLCGRVARPLRMRNAPPIWVVDSPAPLLALAGVARPAVVISRAMMQALESDQLAAALAHEAEHRRSRDNFKRLVMLALPEILPGVRAFAALERAWVRISEWAADEAAAAGDPRKRLALADALVRTARLGGAPRPAGPLSTTLLDDPAELQMRIARLLDEPACPVAGPKCWTTLALAAVALALIAIQPGTLYSVHWLLEGLMR